MRTTTKVIQGGRLTVPAHIREALDLDEGDLVEIDVRPVEEAPAR